MSRRPLLALIALAAIGAAALAVFSNQGTDSHDPDMPGGSSESRPRGGEAAAALAAAARAQESAVKEPGKSAERVQLESPAAEKTPVAASGQITGTVADEAGVPLAGVVIAARPRRSGEAFSQLFLFREPAEAGPKTTTDAQGRFTLAGLEPANYAIRASLTGFTPVETPVELRRDEKKSDVAVRLRRGLAVMGRVMDDLGRPVAGAEVFPRRATSEGNLTVVRAAKAEKTETDAAGAFVLTGLTAEPTEIVAEARGHTRSTSATLTPPGTEEVVLRLPRHGAVEGRIVDASGRPLGQAELSVQRTEGPGFGLQGTESKVDPDGSFRVDGVAPGTVIVVATAAERPTVRSTPVEVRPGETTTGVVLTVPGGAMLVALVVDGNGQPVKGAKVDVHGGPDGVGREVRETLPNGGQRVERQMRRGTPLGGAAGRRLGGPPAGLHGGFQFDGSPAVLASGETGEDGTVKLGGLMPGEVQIRARHETFAPSLVEKVTVVGEEKIDRTMRLRNGGSIEGTCFSASGDALPGEKIIVNGPTEEGDLAQRLEATSDAQGAFALGQLAPGTYVGRFASLDRGPAAIELGSASMMIFDGAERPEERFAVSANVAEASASKLVLRKPMLGAVTGVVTDAGGPVAGARVSLAADRGEPSMGGGQQAKTDDQGVYRLEGLLPGDYLLRWARNASALGSETKLSIGEEGTSLSRNLRIPGGVIKGRVLIAQDGSPVAGAKVQVRRASEPQPGAGQPRQRRTMMAIAMVDSGSGAESMTVDGSEGEGAFTKTDEDGNFSVGDLPEGSLELKITHASIADFESGPILLTPDGRHATGDLRAERGGSLKGQIVRAGGGSVELASVEAVPIAGGDSKNALAQQGAFSFRGLKPGAYRVTARLIMGDTRGEIAPVEVKIEGGKTEKVTLEVK